jgi:hypothetical protein
MVRYFEWMGAARYTADRRSGSMHGKQFLLDAVHAGIDHNFVYGRLDFVGKLPEDEFQVVVNLESWVNHGFPARRELRLEAEVQKGRMISWKVSGQETDKVLASSSEPGEVRVALARNFEFGLPLAGLQAAPLELHQIRNPHNSELAIRVRLRFSLWSNRLPVDALPVEGWIDLELLREEDLIGQ